MEMVKEEVPVEESITTKCTRNSAIDRPESPSKDAIGNTQISVDYDMNPNYDSQREYIGIRQG